MAYIYSKSWKPILALTSSIIIIEDPYLQTFLHSLVKALLIINPFRTKPLSDRDPVCETQINLAKRNGSLIITTEQLLRLFQCFQNDELNSRAIETLFSNSSGLLNIKD